MFLCGRAQKLCVPCYSFEKSLFLWPAALVIVTAHLLLLWQNVGK